MPIFRVTKKLWFPDPSLAEPEGVLAVGGDLSPQRLLLAYASGIFPWFSEGEPILWWSPPERAVVTPAEAHIGRSIRKVLNRGHLQVRADTRFLDVVRACADT